MSKDKSIVGDLINFRGLVYAPINENGVIFLFGRVADDLHMYIEEIKPGFPDCVARRFTGKGWERVLIEFEYLSSNFKLHGHNQDGCDIIICWEHDWKGCPIEVIELRTEIMQMHNHPVKKPTSSINPNLTDEEALERLFKQQNVSTHVQKWYIDIVSALREWNPEIWVNIGKKFIGLYSPERSFAQFSPSTNSLWVEYFSRGEPIHGTKVSNLKLAPRWGKFTVKQTDHVAATIDNLKIAHQRLKDAIHSGEPTSYFSGSKSFDDINLENDDTD